MTRKAVVIPTAIKVGSKWQPYLIHYEVDDRFSVIQYFTDGTYETVRASVAPEEATAAFNHYTNNVASRMGITSRVIITDGGDSIVLEWRHNQGITWPNPSNKEPTDD